MPTVIELEWHTGGKDSYIYFYPLWDSDGKRSGQATTKKLSLFDVDGNQVGRQYIDCMATSHTGWVCTLVSVLKDSPYTDKGTVVATGVSKHRPGKPNISTIPVGRVRCVQQRRRAGDPGRGRREGQVQALPRARLTEGDNRISSNGPIREAVSARIWQPTLRSST